VIRFKKIAIFAFFCIFCFLQSCTYTIYVTRHAEKEISENQDPPLTAIGKERADKLRYFLEDKKVKLIFSTNTTRTKKTAEPFAHFTKTGISIYDPKKTELLTSEIKNIKKNTLIIGHSNTVKDIVNKLNGKAILEKDLEDLEYDKLFIIKRSAFLKPRTKVFIY
jgi:phosphohistidine phosphatase SixA